MRSTSQTVKPSGTLISQTTAMPKDTNANGDIFGGWLLGQMDLAAGICAGRIARGRVATVAISDMAFIHPVPVGAVVSCYVETLRTGNTSVDLAVEVWITSATDDKPVKVTKGTFVFVAIDENGRPRPLKGS